MRLSFIISLLISSYFLSFGQTVTPKHYYPLNSNALDSMGTMNGYILGNNISFINDESSNPNSAIHFAANSSSYIDLNGSTTSLSFIPNTVVFSISLKLKLSDLDQAQTIFGTGKTYNPGFKLHYDGTLKFTLFHHLQFTLDLEGPPNAIPDNDWHHIVVTGNGSSISIYIDGQLYKSGTRNDYINNKPSSNMSRTLFVGAMNNLGSDQDNLSNASIDELRFFDQTISSSEIYLLQSFTSSTPVGATSAINTSSSVWNLNENNNNISYNSGSVSIGQEYNNTQYKLSVKGKILAEGVTVKTYNNWPDYVFYKDYPIMPLSEIKKFIDKNGHLPGVPSAKEVADKGIDIEVIVSVLLKKIEEITLHSIEFDKRISRLEKNKKDSGN